MIILTLRRSLFLPDRTLGTLSWDGNGQWVTLEDFDRGLHQYMSPQSIEQVKKKDETAIPYGFYEVVISLSYRFKRTMPEILKVPGFEGIRIHTGNGPKDSSGCILVGKYVEGSGIAHSLDAYNELFLKLGEALNTNHRVFLSVTK